MKPKLQLIKGEGKVSIPEEAFSRDWFMRRPRPRPRLVEKKEEKG